MDPRYSNSSTPSRLRYTDGSSSMWKRRGVNYIDVYQRTGNLEIPKPFTPGYEGVGRVREIGPGVANFKPGTRVAWINNFGPYAEEIILPATTEQGAAVSGRHCPHCPILTDRVQIDPVSSIRITLSGRRPDSALCVPGMRRCDVRKAPHLGRPAEHPRARTVISADLRSSRG